MVPFPDEIVLLDLTKLGFSVSDDERPLDTTEMFNDHVSISCFHSQY